MNQQTLFPQLPAARCPLPTPYVRWILRQDYTQVARIERASFAHPWTMAELVQYFDEPRAVRMGLVVEDGGGQIDGYLLFALMQSGYRIDNLAVAPERGFRGLGRLLIDRLRQMVAEYHRAGITAIVWERNLPAQLFFRAVGFRAIGLRRGAFDRDAPGDDGIVFRWRAGKKAGGAGHDDACRGR